MLRTSFIQGAAGYIIQGWMIDQLHIDIILFFYETNASKSDQQSERVAECRRRFMPFEEDEHDDPYIWRYPYIYLFQ